MVLNGTSDNGFVDQLMLAKWFPLLRVLKCKLERSLCICGLTWAWKTWCKICQMKIVECKWKNIYQSRSLPILPPMVLMTLQLKQSIFNLLIITPTILEIFLHVNKSKCHIKRKSTFHHQMDHQQQLQNLNKWK
jgi:hypothetical protein